MSLDIQFNIKSDPNKVIYLHEHSYWYKLLTRNPKLFDEFSKEVKRNNRQELANRFSNTLNMIEVLQNIISTLK